MEIVGLCAVTTKVLNNTILAYIITVREVMVQYEQIKREMENRTALSSRNALVSSVYSSLPIICQLT